MHILIYVHTCVERSECLSISIYSYIYIGVFKYIHVYAVQGVSLIGVSLIGLSILPGIWLVSCQWLSHSSVITNVENHSIGHKCKFLYKVSLGNIYVYVNFYTKFFLKIYMYMCVGVDKQKQKRPSLCLLSLKY